MSQLPFSGNPASSGYIPITKEELLVQMAERLARLQHDVDQMSTKLDRAASEQSTSRSISDIADQLKQMRDIYEGRVRGLEDWKNGIEAQVKFVYGFAALAATVSGVIGHYWKT